MASSGTIQFPALSATPSPPPTGSYLLYAQSDNTLRLEDSLGNVYVFGSTGFIETLTGDVTTGSVVGGSAVATVDFVGGQSASAVATATIAYGNATSSNTPSTLVLRDSSGNFSAGTITASLTGNVSGSSSSFTGSLAGDVTGTQSATAIASTIVTGKLLTGYVIGSNTPILNSDSILIAFEKLQAQVSGASGTAITQLNGDVTAIGPGNATATVVSVGGQTAAAVAYAATQVAAATSTNTASTLVLRDASGNFSAGTITAALNGNATTATSAISFTGSLSGDVTGTQSATSIASSVVSGKLLTGYVIGTNTPILSTDSILGAFEKIQAQINGTTGTAITQLTGDVSAVGPGSVAATVNSVGGSSAANIHTAELAANAATSSDTISTIVKRDGSGNFSAGIITAALVGNVTGNVSGSAASFTGSLSGDVIGTQSATVVASVGGKTASDIATAVTAVDNATSINTASTLVERDASGNFAAGTITAALNGNATTSTTSTNFTGSLSGDVTGTQSATSILSTVVTGKLLTGYVSGTNTPILATDSILIALEKLQAQVSGTSGTAITQLTGDVVAVGPGSVAATIEAIQGTAVSGTTGTTNVVFSANPTLTGVLNGGSAIFSSTISASNLSGTNTGDVTLNNTNSIDLAFTSGQTGLSATLNISSDTADSGNLKATASIHSGVSPGLFIEYPFGTPVQIGTTNASGAASSFSLSDHVHAITSPVVLSLLLTGYVTGTNTPISASNSFLTAFENLQAQIGAISSAAVTTIGAIDSQTAQANGLDIVGNTLYAQSASTSNPGMVNLSTQSFAGNKTFAGTIAITPSSTSALVINTNSFIFDSVNNALGIGIQPATNTFIDAINSTAASKTLQLTGYGTGSTVGTRGRFARGTSSSPTAAQTGDIINFWSARGYGASQFAAASTAAINAVAGEAFTNASNLTYLQFSTTPTGSVTSAESMRVASTGVTLGPQSSSTAGHQINGGVAYTTRTVSASTFTVDTTTSDYIIYTDSTSNTITITLPVPTNGRTLIIQDKTGKAGKNSITIKQNLSETINGKTSFVLDSIYAGVMLTSDGTNWAATTAPIMSNTITASTYTVDTTNYDNIIFTDSTSNAITITLPAASSGRILSIQDKTGQASTNHITITPPGTVNINGVNASIIIGTNYSGWVFRSDGTNWIASQLLPIVPAQAITASSIDWSTGTMFTKTLSANTTFTFANAVSGQTIVIRLTNTASNYTVTWPTIKWPVQTTPVMTTGAFSDVYTIIYDGTTFYGSYVQNF